MRGVVNVWGAWLKSFARNRPSTKSWIRRWIWYKVVNVVRCPNHDFWQKYEASPTQPVAWRGVRGLPCGGVVSSPDLLPSRGGSARLWGCGATFPTCTVTLSTVPPKIVFPPDCSLRHIWSPQDKPWRLSLPYRPWNLTLPYKPLRLTLLTIYIQNPAPDPAGGPCTVAMDSPGGPLIGGTTYTL